MKKTMFFMATVFALLFASCGQLTTQSAKNTVNLNVNSESVFARTIEYSNEANEIFVLTFQILNGSRVVKTQRFRGSLLELKKEGKVFSVPGIEIGQTVKVRCLISKDGIPGYFWQGESSEVTIDENLTEPVEVTLTEQNPSERVPPADTTPLVVYNNFISKSVQMKPDYDYNNGQIQHKVCQQYYFLAPDNTRQIKAGDRYTFTFTGKASAKIKSYYFNIIDRDSLYSGGYEKSMLSRGGYESLVVNPNTEFSFTRTITIDKDAPLPQEVLFDLTFHLEEEFNTNTAAFLQEASCSFVPIAPTAAASDYIKGNVNIDSDERSTTVVTLDQTVEPEWPIQNQTVTMKKTQSNVGYELQYSKKLLASGELQKGDVFTINFSAKAPVPVKGCWACFITKNSITGIEWKQVCITGIGEYWLEGPKNAGETVSLTGDLRIDENLTYDDEVYLYVFLYPVNEPNSDTNVEDFTLNAIEANVVITN